MESRYLRGRKSAWQNIAAFSRRVLDVLRLNKTDLVVLEGEVLPYAPALFERWLNIRQIPFVVDFDDAIFHYYDKSSNWLIRRVLGKKISSVIRRSACVIAGNQYLSDYATASQAKRIEIVPTVVDLNKYPDDRVDIPGRLGFHIGWIGSPGSSRYLQSIKDSLSYSVLTDGCRLLLVGAGADHGLDAIQPEMLKWSEDTEVESIKRFDVGIMPLPDDDWAKGKCGFKLIQYMACGIPVIASPVGANCDIVTHGVNGFLAKTTEDWIQYLRLLEKNPELARKMGEAGRRMVEQKYCLQVTGRRLADILVGCCKISERKFGGE